MLNNMIISETYVLQTILLMFLVLQGDITYRFVGVRGGWREGVLKANEISCIFC
jgi:hypothetical protein